MRRLHQDWGESDMNFTVSRYLNRWAKGEPKWKSNEEQHIWGHCFWMTRPGLRSSPIISDPNMNWWAALRICDCFEAGVCSFRFMMKQYQAPDVLIRSIQFSEFHCDHESKVYFGPAKNAAIHLRLGLNFDPYPMWGCPKNEAHPMQMGSSWFIITFQTKSPNYDKLDEPIRYIVLLWYNLWL
jgi:hypothetical protein